MFFKLGCIFVANNRTVYFFFVFIVDLGFRDYFLSRVSASSGQDHAMSRIKVATAFAYHVQKLFGNYRDCHYNDKIL